MIELYRDSKVYIVAPAGVATGGPELLHQLCFHLREDLGIESYMYYYPIYKLNPVHENYIKYKNPYVKKIVDDRRNIIITPEIFSSIMIMNKYRNIRKVIWWLSVDNFYLSMISEHKFNYFFEKTVNYLSKIFFDKVIYDIEKLMYIKFGKMNSSVLKTFEDIPYHFVQSHYAYVFLKNSNFQNVKIYFLSDYLNIDFLKTKTDISKKENIVAYNPKKGYYFTHKIKIAASDINFIPLENMKREEVIETLQKAKLYIDFGTHPGKDRIPREAAILGCCVITGKRGSAAYFEDVPIPDEYKFEDKEENIPRIIEKIKDCFENFEERYKDFDYYRQVIKNEPQKFIEDMKKIFGNVP